MSNAMKKLLERLIELMKEEGIKYLTISRQSRWNAEEKRTEESDDYSINFELSSRFK